MIRGLRTGRNVKKAAVKVFKISAFAVVLLVSLTVLAGAIISYSSRRSGRRKRRACWAKGEKLSLRSSSRRRTWTKRNFFFDPIWMELIDTEAGASNSQMEVAEPKVPKGQRQLDLIDKPVSAELKERALRLLRN